MKDCGGGSYTASVSSIRAGILTLSATINGEMVGLPITVAVEPGPLATLVACSSAPLHCVAGAGQRLWCRQGSARAQPQAAVLDMGTFASDSGGVQRFLGSCHRRHATDASVRDRTMCCWTRISTRGFGLQ